MGILESFRRFAGSSKASGSQSEDYMELQVQEGDYRFGAPSRYVKVCKLTGFADVENTARELSDRNIIILDIKPLAERSMNELKHAVDEIKNVCVSMGGDIAGLSEYHLIITPPDVRIERSRDSRLQSFEDTMENVKRKSIR